MDAEIERWRRENLEWANRTPNLTWFMLYLITSNINDYADAGCPYGLSREAMMDWMWDTDYIAPMGREDPVRFGVLMNELDTTPKLPN